MQTIKLRAQDGQSIMRFFHYAVLVIAMSLFSTTAMAEKVNLNQADAETLQYIPGIGPGKSADIVKLREQNGGFTTFEQLLDVRGIGARTLEDVKQYGTLVGGVTELTQDMRDNPPSRKRAASESNQGQSSG